LPGQDYWSLRILQNNLRRFACIGESNPWDHWVIVTPIASLATLISEINLFQASSPNELGVMVSGINDAQPRYRHTGREYPRWRSIDPIIAGGGAKIVAIDRDITTGWPSIVVASR